MASIKYPCLTCLEVCERSLLFMAALNSDDSAWLSSVVTIIVTTSPIPSDPDLDLLRAVYKSFEAVGLGYCPKIVVCDHFDACEKAKKGGGHKGKLPAARIAAYKERISKFRQAEFSNGTHVLELDKRWHGFAMATKRALDAVTTPLVCIIQHDLAFLRYIDLRSCAERILASCDQPLRPNVTTTGDEAAPVVKCGVSDGPGTAAVYQELGKSCAAQSDTVRSPPVNYVCFRHHAQKYREMMRSRCHLEIGDPVEWPPVLGPGKGGEGAPSGRGCRLTRLPQFFDGTHLASTEWYRAVFILPLLHGKPLGFGQFTEDNLGQHMLAQAKLSPRLIEAPEVASDGSAPGISSTSTGSGMSASVSWGVVEVVEAHGGWLWSDGEVDTPIFHLDGRLFLSIEERRKRGIPDKDMRYRITAAAVETCP